MQLQDLKYLETLSETLSFRKTAARFRVSQSTVSRAIARVESQLGAQLFSREGGKVWLSAFGRAMKPMLDDLRDGLEKAETHADSLLRAKEGRLVVGMDNHAPYALFESFFTGFSGKIPHIDLDITHGPGAALERRLLSADLDVIITNPERGLDEALRSTTLLVDQYVLAAHRDHVDMEGRPVGGLKPLVAYHGSLTKEMVCQMAEAIPGLSGQCHHTDRTDWLLGMVKSGMGLALLPARLALAEDLVVVESLENLLMPTELAMVTVRGRAFSPALRAFDREAIQFARSAQHPVSIASIEALTTDSAA